MEPKGTDTILKKNRFSEIHQHARLANAAYQSPAKIKQISAAYGYQLTKHGIVPSVDVQYFLVTHPATKAQLISVRGTANLENALVDMKVEMLTDKRAGIRLHRGFSSAAQAIYKELKPHLNKQQPVYTVGHSLGGAVAVILAISLDVDGYMVGRVTTFGQPKVTDRSGADKFKHLPITRVVNEKDVVPLVPHIEAKLLELPSIYWHLGEEIVMLPGRFYSSLSGKQSMVRGLTVLKANVTARDLDAHRMAIYMVRIEEKMNAAENIPYSERMNYIDAKKTP
jgi:hypothetical protein